jgi:hypothetical protein
VVSQLSSGWKHNYLTKTSQTGCANEKSIYSLMSMLGGKGQLHNSQGTRKGEEKDNDICS